MASISSEKIRRLTRDDLGLPKSLGGETKSASPSPAIESFAIDDENPLFDKVRDALELGFAGVVFIGPPGTGKSTFAKHIANALAGKASAVRFVQFHPSYQYEDFVEGYAPSDDGVIVKTPRIFKTMCESAALEPKTLHVLVIDEISRCDAARVFGEALTYLETDKRGMKFTLASGSELSVPPNLVILATMNPWDKGVDDIDIALERRFAYIQMPPNSRELRKLLLSSRAEPSFVDRVVTFFEGVQSLDDDACHLGHAYFLGCINEDAAGAVWDFRLRPFFQKACRLDPDLFSKIEKSWADTIAASPATSDVTANNAPSE